MRKLKIYSVPSHATADRMSGVDFVRVVQPMEHLNGFKYKGVEFETKVYSPKDDKGADWRKIAEEYDAIFFNYTVSAWAFAAMGAMARKNGIPMILDVDDSLWDIQPDNPSYVIRSQNDGELIKNFTAICNEVDHITTTNQFLKNVILHHTNKKSEQISIHPNRIDFKLYSHRPTFKDTNEINLLYFGSTTHFADLANRNFVDGIDMVFKRYPNVTLTTVGAFTPSHKRKWGVRYNNAFGHQDVYKWIKERLPIFADQSDILVVPLENNTYNLCKSSIKFIEASSVKLPGVWQNIRQYKEVIKEGETGFLADKPKEWYKAIKKLIDDKELRRTIGENAFKETKDNWQMKDHLEPYAKLFIDMTQKHSNIN